VSHCRSVCVLCHVAVPPIFLQSVPLRYILLYKQQSFLPVNLYIEMFPSTEQSSFHTQFSLCQIMPDGTVIVLFSMCVACVELGLLVVMCELCSLIHHFREGPF
jgi:hypothetical protein